MSFPALLLAVGLLPVIAIMATAAAAPNWMLRRRVGRTPRVLTFVLCYIGIEALWLAAALWPWLRYLLRHNEERYAQAAYRALERGLSRLRVAAEGFCGLRVIPGRLSEGAPLASAPLVVCGRHGGPGGAFLLVQLLLEHDRRPRLVLKQSLAWDPLLDVLVNRVPHTFIDPDPRDRGATASAVGSLADAMQPGDVLLIFPEGGNFTPRRRLRAIIRLRRRGLAEHARRAARLRNLLPPHPDGLFAALDAAPRADVVFVAHTGLDHMMSAPQAWRAVPLADPVRFTWWSTPAGAVPATPDERLRWLEANWTRIDQWVSAAKGSPEQVAPAVPPPTDRAAAPQSNRTAGTQESSSVSERAPTRSRSA